MYWLWVVLFNIIMMDSSFSKKNTFEIQSHNSQVICKTQLLGFKDFGFDVKKYNGSIHYNKKDILSSWVSVEIDTHSLKSGYDFSDDLIVNEYFLDSKKFPIIKFVSNRILVIDPTVMIIKGNLTIKGITRKAVMQAQLANRSADGSEIHFIGHMNINLSQFNLDLVSPVFSTNTVVSMNIIAKQKNIQRKKNISLIAQ